MEKKASTQSMGFEVKKPAESEETLLRSKLLDIYLELKESDEGKNSLKDSNKINRKNQFASSFEMRSVASLEQNRAQNQLCKSSGNLVGPNRSLTNISDKFNKLNPV